MQWISHDHYVIYYDANTVVAKSSSRLTFEPKGWQVDFRNDLRTAIKKLCTKADKGVYASYGSLKEEPGVDVENLLFYNIGTACFKNLASDFVCFEKLSIPETERILLGDEQPQYNHYYCYQISMPLMPWIKAHKLVEWKNVDCGIINSTTKPAQHWLAMKQYPDRFTFFHPRKIQGNFGLDIVLQVPHQVTINIANVMKPLIDGIICYFHSMPELELEPEKMERLTALIPCAPSLLLTNDYAVLGERRFVSGYREGIKWNPGDDNCVLLNIRTVMGDNYGFAGTLYEL